MKLSLWSRLLSKTQPLQRVLPIFYLLSISFLFPFLGVASEFRQERELYETLPGDSDQGGILDATNPMDLMNRLRRATAMDNATNPADAVDEALKVFQEIEPIPLQNENL